MDGGKSDESKWPVNAIKLLLTVYKKNKENFCNSKIKKKILWRKISDEMEENGVREHNVEKVERKFRNLKHTYDTIRLKNKSKGQRAIKWEFFKDMEEIFAEDHTVAGRTSQESIFVSSEENEEQHGELFSILCKEEATAFHPPIKEELSDVETDNILFGETSNDGMAQNAKEIKSSTPIAPNQQQKIIKANTQRKRYYQTKQILNIERERNETLKGIRAAMEEPIEVQKRRNDLFETYITTLIKINK